MSDYCDCTITDPRRNVLVDINDGRITVIACGNCEYPILLDGSVDDFERVYANGLMLAMTTSVEPVEEHRGFGRYETVGVRFRELTAHEDGAVE